MKKYFFLALLVLIAISYLYNHRDMFQSHDTISFGATPVELQKKIKVFAFTNNPQKVEYKGNEWYGDGKPAIVVYDGKNNYGLAKEYEHVLFYITVGEKPHFYQLNFDKSKTRDAYDIQLTVTPKDTSYFVKGFVFHLDHQFIAFNGNTQALRPEMEVLYPR
ncbi:MAG: hypothetical protein M3R17_08160 [Bacteroidota bacterium]|nr:hypothetical protein [Bacteroidota bacterium]